MVLKLYLYCWVTIKKISPDFLFCYWINPIGDMTKISAPLLGEWVKCITSVTVLQCMSLVGKMFFFPICHQNRKWGKSTKRWTAMKPGSGSNPYSQIKEKRKLLLEFYLNCFVYPNWCVTGWITLFLYLLRILLLNRHSYSKGSHILCCIFT